MRKAGDGLDQDAFGKLRTQSQAGIAYLAQQIALEIDNLDALIFAKAHFAQPLIDFWSGDQPSDDHGGARSHSI